MKVTLKDETFALYLREEEILGNIAEIGKRISADYAGRTPLLLGVLNGSFLFAADLIREVKCDCQITFVKLASYIGTGSSGEVRELVGLAEDIRGRDIIVVEDIVDTGLTLEKVMDTLQKHSPASVKVATLLYKPEAYKGKHKIDYVAMEIPNAFIVGYGLDYDGLGRNLRDIYQIVS